MERGGVDGVGCRYLRFRPLSEAEGGFKGNKCLRVGAFGVPLLGATSAVAGPRWKAGTGNMVEYVLESAAETKGKIRSNNRLGERSRKARARRRRGQWQRKRRNLQGHMREALTGKTQRYYDPSKIW